MALYSGRRTWLWATLTGSCRMPTWACCPPAPVSGWRATQDCGSPVPARTTHTASSANPHAVKPTHHTKPTHPPHTHPHHRDIHHTPLPHHRHMPHRNHTTHTNHTPHHYRASR